MNKLFVLMTSILFYSSIFCEPRIAILMGSGSAGKTTIGQVLKDNTDWHVVDEDILFYDLRMRCLEKTVPDEYATIKKAIDYGNILHAIILDNIVFKESCDDEDCAKAIIAIKSIKEIYRQIGYKFNENDVLAEIQNGLDAQKNVLVVRWFTKVETIKEKFIDTQVLTSLAFCSLLCCYKRFKGRNKKSPNDKRIYQQLVPHYVELFKLTNDLSSGAAQFKKYELELWFDKISRRVKPDNELRGRLDLELNVSQLNELRDKLITDDLNAVVCFTPRDQYDIILDIENVTPLEAAKALLHQIEEFQKNSV